LDKDRIFYGVGRLELHIPHSRSLKDKRAVMKSLKSKLAERSRVSVVETGPQDFWQRGTLGAALAARDEATVRDSLASILRLVERDDRVIVLSYETRIGSLDDEPAEGEE
jgi:uncharacterized protein YlxP (DUF503 family)